MGLRNSKIKTQNPHKFILITSKTCGACVNFNRNIKPSLLSGIASIPSIEAVVLEVPTRSTKDLESPEFDCPNIMAKLVRYYPIIFICTSETWEREMSDPTPYDRLENILRMDVNQYMDYINGNTGFQVYNASGGMSAVSIVDWTKEVLQRPEYQRTIPQNNRTIIPNAPSAEQQEGDSPKMDSPSAKSSEKTNFAPVTNKRPRIGITDTTAKYKAKTDEKKTTDNYYKINFVPRKK